MQPAFRIGNDDGSDHDAFMDIQTGTMCVYDLHRYLAVKEITANGVPVWSEFDLRASLTGATFGGASRYPGHTTYQAHGTNQLSTSLLAVSHPI